MTANELKWKPLIGVGLVSGLLQVTAGVTMYLAGVYFARWSMLVSILVLAACIAAGMYWYGRRVLDGRTTYWSALIVGIVIGVCTGFVYVTYNIISVSFVYSHFLEDMIQAQLAVQQSLGMKASLETLRKEITLGMIVRVNFISLSALGGFLSALISILFRTKRRAGEKARVIL